MCCNNTLDIPQAFGAWIQVQRQEIFYPPPVPINPSSWDGHKYQINKPQEDRGLLQLIPGHKGVGPGSTDIKFIRFQQPLQLPTMEPDLTSSKENSQRTDKSDSGDTNVEISHMFSRRYDSVNFSATNFAGNHDHTRSKKWKF
ncbi:hypothetical protein AYI68_g7702 [Smittium mucronatum]|uniref:Uncharacterized protein n=1 Tax=Smittium mucronatum TaxID=133383 RepID=A0A1R0GMX7_9FUNG|nr:hypothetical protein AYI68_g7702 [Smittium mucronatum]